VKERGSGRREPPVLSSNGGGGTNSGENFAQSGGAQIRVLGAKYREDIGVYIGGFSWQKSNKIDRFLWRFVCILVSSGDRR
jgi:hypothetical protein